MFTIIKGRAKRLTVFTKNVPTLVSVLVFKKNNHLINKET